MSLYTSGVFDDRELTTSAIWQARVLQPVSDLITPLFGDAGWTTMTLAGAWTPASTAYACRYRVQGTRVYVEGLITGGASGSTVYTFPVGLRPGFSHQWDEYAGAAGVCRFRITSSGALAVAGVSASGNLASNVDMSGINWEIGS